MNRGSFLRLLDRCCFYGPYLGVARPRLELAFTTPYSNERWLSFKRRGFSKSPEWYAALALRIGTKTLRFNLFYRFTPFRDIEVLARPLNYRITKERLNRALIAKWHALYLSGVGKRIAPHDQYRWLTK